MALAATDLETDSIEARARLEAASTIYDTNLNAFLGRIELLDFLVIPELEAAVYDARDAWTEVRPRIATVLESEISTPESAEARVYIRTEGPRLEVLAAAMLDGLALQMETTRKRLWLFLFGGVVFNLSLVATGYFLVRQKVVGPLRRLEQAALTLRSGELAARVEHRESDEIGLLERAFNEMAREIESLVASLEERRAFAESLITHAPVGVVVHRGEEVVFANPHTLTLLGVSSIDEVTSGLRTALFGNGQADSEGSSPVARELNIPRPGESERTVEILTVRIEYEGKDAEMTILRDITERQEIAARMMQIDRVAALGTLLAGMGHEINNPLSFLTNNLEYSLDLLDELRNETGGEEGGNAKTIPPEWEDRLAELVAALRESTLGAERIRDIVARLRSFSRVDDTPKRTIGLAAALESSIRMAEGEIRHRARLIRDFRTAPPVKANESQMGQVFLNLLINAAHAIEEGNVVGNTITVSLFTRGDLVIVEISDTGPGIPQEVATRIFDPFFTTKPPGQGTGLGLSICQKIVEDHDGLITFRSEEGKGTTFRISLPVAEEVAAPPPRPKTATHSAKRRRFAVIDDDPMVCRGLQRLLERGNEVHACTDARTFLEAIERGERYDAIFCDLMMPEMTGMELHDILAERYPDVLARTIFMTGGAFTPQAERFLDDLQNPLLFKPFDLDQIFELVERLDSPSATVGA